MSKIAPRILGGSILAGLGYVAYNLFTDGFQEAKSDGSEANNVNESVFVDTKNKIEDTNSSNRGSENSSDSINVNNNNVENLSEVTDNESNEINNEVITEVSLDGIDINNAVENESSESKKETAESLNESTETKGQNFIERVIQV